MGSSIRKLSFLLLLPVMQRRSEHQMIQASGVRSKFCQSVRQCFRHSMSVAEGCRAATGARGRSLPQRNRIPQRHGMYVRVVIRGGYGFLPAYSQLTEILEQPRARDENRARDQLRFVTACC